MTSLEGSLGQQKNTEKEKVWEELHRDEKNKGTVEWRKDSKT